MPLAVSLSHFSKDFSDSGKLIADSVRPRSPCKGAKLGKSRHGSLPRNIFIRGPRPGPTREGICLSEKPWSGLLRGTDGDPENKRIKESYFSRFIGKYLNGDGTRVNADGDYRLMGRIDEVINISGHRNL